jgi:hypothetical protein
MQLQLMRKSAFVEALVPVPVALYQNAAKIMTKTYIKSNVSNGLWNAASISEAIPQPKFLLDACPHFQGGKVV